MGNYIDNKIMKLSLLLTMAAAHFILMYMLMYSMVNTSNDIYPSLNQLYMAGVMTAPMLILEGFLMGQMYENRNGLILIMIISSIVFILFFIGIRQQVAINDKEFLKSMIPHHSGAILMCEQSNIEDMEIRELCETIVAAQKTEIEQMKEILERLN